MLLCHKHSHFKGFAADVDAFATTATSGIGLPRHYCRIYTNTSSSNKDNNTMDNRRRQLPSRWPKSAEVGCFGHHSCANHWSIAHSGGTNLNKIQFYLSVQTVLLLETQRSSRFTLYIQDHSSWVTHRWLKPSFPAWKIKEEFVPAVFDPCALTVFTRAGQEFPNNHLFSLVVTTCRWSSKNTTKPFRPLNFFLVGSKNIRNIYFTQVLHRFTFSTMHLMSVSY